jgi:hypothetical protein
MTTLFKKLSITGGAIAVLVALIVNVGVNQNSQFEVDADPIPGTYTRTLDGMIYQWNTTTNRINSFEKYAGTNTRVLLQNTTSRTWTNLGGGYNRLPVTFSGTNNGVNPPPNIMIEQIQNIRTVVANFSTTAGSVNFVYDYLDLDEDLWSGEDASEYEIQSDVSSDTVYSTPLKTTGFGATSYPDRLIISFPFDTSTFTSLTITYDC